LGVLGILNLVLNLVTILFSTVSGILSKLIALIKSVTYYPIPKNTDNPATNRLRKLRRESNKRSKQKKKMVTVAVEAMVTVAVEAMVTVAVEMITISI